MTPRDLDELVDAAEWHPLDWWKLEIRSLDAAPLVQSDLVVLAPAEAVKAEYTRVSAAGCVQGLAYLYLLVGPLIGAILMFTWWQAGSGSGMPLATAGVLTAIALVVTVASEIRSRRHPRPTTVRAVVSIAALQLVPGLATALIALTAPRETWPAGALWWLLVIAADMAVHLVVAFRARIMPRGSSTGALTGIRLAVAELDPATTRDLLARRGAALRRLEERGLIDAADREHADAAPLGELGWTMATELAKQYRPDAATGRP